MNISTTSSNSNKRAMSIYVILFLILLISLIILSLCIGSSFIHPTAIINLIFGKSDLITFQKIIFIRLPRTIAAIIVGAGLSLSGYVLQQVLQNELCSPNIIGVNAGAGLFVVISSLLIPIEFIFLKPFMALIGGIIAVFCVFFIATKTNSSNKAILLSGVAVNSLLIAITDAIVTINPDLKIIRADFAIGSLQNITNSNIIYVLPYLSLVLILLFLIQYDLNILALGDETATSLGLNVGRTRTIFLIIAAVLAGISVSLGGLIGFVGLIIPHIMKILFGLQAKYILVLTSISGACLCLASDIIARSLFSPYEIPVGIVLSVIGAPFFLSLIISRRH